MLSFYQFFILGTALEKPYEPIPKFDLSRMMQEGNFQKIRTLVQEVSPGDLILVLNTYGEITQWYILSLRDTNLSRHPRIIEVIARNTEGLDFILDSSMGDCYDCGWRFTRKEETAVFWSSISSLQRISGDRSPC